MMLRQISLKRAAVRYGLPMAVTLLIAVVSAGYALAITCEEGCNEGDTWKNEGDCEHYSRTTANETWADENDVGGTMETDNVATVNVEKWIVSYCTKECTGKAYSRASHGGGDDLSDKEDDGKPRYCHDSGGS